jgi:hypothetical protein
MGAHVGVGQRPTRNVIFVHEINSRRMLLKHRLFHSGLAAVEPLRARRVHPPKTLQNQNYQMAHRPYSRGLRRPQRADVSPFGALRDIPKIGRSANRVRREKVFAAGVLFQVIRDLLAPIERRNRALRNQVGNEGEENGALSALLRP